MPEPAPGSEIVRLTPEDDESTFAQIAALHVEGIHHGILPLFGDRFLARLYRYIAQAPQSGVWCVRDDSEVMGFIAGCMNLGEVFRWVLLRKGLGLATAAGRALLSPRVLEKLPSMLTYLRAEQDDAEGYAPELLAIAVSARGRGQGLGRRLVTELESGFKSWGLSGRYRVSTNIEEQVSNAFYRSLGFRPARTLRHHALTLQLYDKECT
jgi:GNAT superfamily N-acetyltransferase